MECILDCNYLLLQTLLGEGKIQFHRGMECILDCIFSFRCMNKQVKAKLSKPRRLQLNLCRLLGKAKNEVVGGVGGRKQWHLMKAKDLIG